MDTKSSGSFTSESHFTNPTTKSIRKINEFVLFADSIIRLVLIDIAGSHKSYCIIGVWEIKIALEITCTAESCP